MIQAFEGPNDNELQPFKELILQLKSFSRRGYDDHW